MPGRLDRVDLSGLSDEATWLYLQERLRVGDWGPLLHGEQAERIRSLLVAELNHVTSELSARASDLAVLEQECHAQGPAGKARWFEAQAPYNEWRAKAIRFKRLVETRLAETKRAEVVVRRERNEANEASRREDQRSTLRTLALAIAAHQDACRDLGIEPSQADLKLWRVLDEVSVPLGTGTATLAQMLARWL
jgi:hypothetical protein